MDNTGQPALSVTFNCQGCFKVKKKESSKNNTVQVVLYLDLNFQKLAKTWKRQFGSNHIVPDTVFLRAFKTQESYVFSMKIDKSYLRGQYKSLAKVIEATDGNLYIIFVRTIRVKPYCPLIRIF